MAALLSARPTIRPSVAPTTARATPSSRTIRWIWARVAPVARRSPNSRRRSPTESSSVLTTPTSACSSVNSSIHWITLWKPRSNWERWSTNCAGSSTLVTP